MKTKLLKIMVLTAASVLLLTQTAIGLAQDKTPPSDVENVKTEPGDAEISLSWDVATDNVGVVGYKVYYGTKSVGAEGEEYEFAPIVIEDVVTYTLTELENDKTYYFALTAFDAAGNESESYSTEVNATPQAGLHKASIEDDGKNPEVKTAEVKSGDKVKVAFSEPIVLPLENPEKAFTIKNKADSTKILEVKRAELDPEDELGTSVILLTNIQKADEEYELTVGIEIEDHYGNAVTKDTNDKATFKGYKSTEEKVETPKDKTLPDITKVEAEKSNQITVTFTEEIDLGETPKENFTVTNKADNKPLKILNVSLDKDGKIAYLSTDPQEDVEYEIKTKGLKDTAGNEMEEATRTFHGKTSSLKDLLPPEDITELLAQLKEGEKNIVELTWKKSKNTAGDLADQMLYQSLDKGKHYNKGTSLGSDAEQTEVKNLKGGRTYTFKITSKDTSGNESKGTIVSIKLPQTGPALPIVIGISLAAGYFARKKKGAR